MTNDQLSQISDYAMVSGSIVLALALICYVAEWAFARTVEPDAVEQPVAVPAGAVQTGGGRSSRSGGVPDDADRPTKSEMFQGVAVSLTGLAALVLLVSVVTRGFAADRVPWGNMYEFGLTGVTISLIVYLVLVRVWDIGWVGGVVATFGLVILAMARSAYVPAGPIVPALHSYWLVIHVAATMIAGALYLVGAGASALYLVRERAERRESIGRFLYRLPESAVMDQVAYRVNAAAFPLWTFGTLIAGPIWAYQAWGKFWGWDPKEVWALITWIVYAGYLHARATAGWKGRRAAIFALVGFATFAFSFYGVNLFFGNGSLHSYSK